MFFDLPQVRGLSSDPQQSPKERGFPTERVPSNAADPLPPGFLSPVGRAAQREAGSADCLR